MDGGFMVEKPCTREKFRSVIFWEGQRQLKGMARELG